MSLIVIFFFKQKTAYEMRISDWSSDVCSSDLFAIKITVGDFPAILIDKREISANLRSRQRRFVTRRLIPLRPTGNQREKCEKSERKTGFVHGNASHALLSSEIQSLPDRCAGCQACPVEDRKRVVGGKRWAGRVK